MIKISEWAGHQVFRDWNRITKIPKAWSTLINGPWVQRCIDYARDRFWRFVPDTTVEISNWTYRISQKFIEGVHINPENIKTVLSDFNELMRLHSQSLIDEGIWLDFVWLEWALKASLFHLKKYRWTIIDKYFISPLLERVSKTWAFYKIVEFWEQSSVPELANIMIDNDGNIFVVDLSLTEKHTWVNAIVRTRARIIEMYNRHYLKKYFWIDLI
jgi:hypothetical protein